VNIQLKVPYVNLVAQHSPIKDELMAAIGKVIDSGRFVLGREVDDFEQRFAELAGCRFAVGLNSGTDALIFGLKALGIGEGDEVITAPNSFLASASSIALLGATPVFVDVGKDYNLDPGLLEAAITSRTRAIMPVHLTGKSTDMDGVMSVARKHNIFVIEDCAQAVCAEHNGKRVGSFGEVGCFSLHPLKTLNACGDGGVVTTNDENLYQQFKLLRNHGLRTRDNGMMWAFNSRLDTMQAAVLLTKLDHVEDWTDGRRANAAAYRERLAGLDEVVLPVEEPHQRSVYHTFVIQAERRENLRSFLTDRGVGTAIHYPIPIHLQDAASELGYAKGSFPIAEHQAERILSLPIYPELSLDEITYVTDCIRSFYDGSGL
jgi:dTDP-4-amino-4,6-dideoxygalactose transaminase